MSQNLIMNKINEDLTDCDMEKVRAILFDFDNTLIATRQIDESTCDKVSYNHI